MELRFSQVCLCELWELFNQQCSNSCSLYVLVASYLYLCSLVFRKTFKRTPAHISTPSIYSFVLYCILPIGFQLHQFPLLPSVPPEFNKITMFCLGSLYCASGHKKSGCSLFSFCFFFSLREHNTVLKTVISYMLSRFLAVYDVREISLPLKLPTWLEA